MTQVFFCKQTDQWVFYQHWWCDACDTIILRELTGRGPLTEDWSAPPSLRSEVKCSVCYNQARVNGSHASQIFIRTDTGEELYNIRDHPGACFEEKLPYYDRRTRQPRTGPDGRVLTVICPNGQEWTLDSRASNCTLPDDNEHRCWVRSGHPEDGTLHVDKNGHTCRAGEGSISMASYHGFLHGGRFVRC